MISATQRQRDAFRFISDFIRERGYSPSLDEIGAGLDLTSRSTIQRLVNGLVERGLIRRFACSPRGLRIVDAPRGRKVAHNLRLTDFPIEPALKAMESIDALQDRRAA